MNNSNALAEIQSKYPNCNLLLPSATSVQINPFYKCSVMEVVADTAPNSGDIFSVGKVKTGEDGKGKAIYEDVFSPAKPLLMKLATAAGIQFHPEYTTVTRENTNTYVGKAYGAVRLALYVTLLPQKGHSPFSLFRSLILLRSTIPVFWQCVHSNSAFPLDVSL